MPNTLYKWVVRDGSQAVPIGYLLPVVVRRLMETSASFAGRIQIDHHSRTMTVVSGGSAADVGECIAEIVQCWRKQRVFSILETSTREPWPVYKNADDLVCTIERSAAGLFGVNRYGVHLTGYVRCPNAKYGLKIWVPTRSASKSTFPGMLDNTVAGGLVTGEDPLECVIREADEEASLPQSFVRSSAKAVGTITYVYITDRRAGGESGLIYPECQWIYDLEMPAEIIPRPNDGEVESFDLCTVEEIQEQLSKGRFKPNCALVMVDFFIRHGILTTAEEPNLEEICQHIHRELPFPGPHEKEKVTSQRSECSIFP